MTAASVATRLRQLVRRGASGANEPHPDLVRLTPEDHFFLTTLHDESVPLPADAEQELVATNPRLLDLRRSYESLDLPVLDASQWREAHVQDFFDLRYFRGESLITWHYRELLRITRLKYFVYLRYIQERDTRGLLGRLDEDGAFGCWTYEYPGYGRFSRDLIESVNELCFLDREFGLFDRDRPRVLDVGAGYGRLAHRMTKAVPDLADYCCVDAIPESTFVCDYYLRHRGCAPPARVLPLTEVESALKPGDFDLVVNIHSFSECTHRAIEWWTQTLARLRIPCLLLIPNEPDHLWSTEVDGTRRDFAPLLERAGYRLIKREPIIAEQAVRELVRIEDQFHLYALDD